MKKIINNTLFENKHYYMLSLKEINVLKEKVQSEVLELSPEDLNSETYEGLSNQLKEITRIWELMFIGLLREGLEFQYIENTNKKEKDLIRIVVDNINYECKATIVLEILKEDIRYVLKDLYEELIERFSLSFKDNQNPKEIENIIIENEDLKNEILMDDTKTNDEAIDLKEYGIYPEESESAEDYPLELEEEFLKSKSSMLYDIHNVEVISPSGYSSKSLKFFVFPMVPEKENMSSKIMVVIKDKFETKCFYSEKTGSVQASFSDEEFIIRGSFSNGEFSSSILTFGTTLSLNYSLNIDTQEIRPENRKNVNFGHICKKIYAKNNDFLGKAHILPLSDENNFKETADFALFLESDGEIIKTIISENNNEIIIVSPLSKERVRLISYWQSGFLNCDTLFNFN